MAFTHLEVHSNLTLLAATPSVESLAARAASDGLAHLALTDTNAMYGAVAFAKACKAVAVQPLIGMTLTVAQPPVGAMSTGRPGAGRPGDGPGQLVLLAKNPTGYRSLCRLSSLIQGSPNREALASQGLALEQITACRDGLICLSGGRRGWVDRFLEAGDLASAQALAGRLAGAFDEDAFLALELHGSGDGARATELAGLARRLGMPVVAVQPVYCLSPEEATRLRLLAAIRANRPLDEGGSVPDAEDSEEFDAEAEFGEAPSVGESRTSPRAGANRGDRSAAQGAHSETFDPAVPWTKTEAQVDTCWLGPDDMAARFKAYPRALDASGEIAARCGAALPDGRPIWPGLDLPNGQTPAGALADLARAGLAQRYPVDAPLSRLEGELDAIAHHGFSPLFLVVADIVRFARSRDVPVSTRGSVANSLVAFCTGITTVDPIEHGLLFERFLNPARANPPDIDLDFCSERRDEVLRYVRDRYGADHVALVSTISTMRAQSAVREVGKAYGLPDDVVSRLAALMPARWHPDPRRQDNRTIAYILPTLEDARQREVVQAAWDLVGTPDHLSVHPGGVVITPGPLTDVVPLQWAPKGFLVTQYQHSDVEAIGLQKLDLLGIRALTVLADAAELIRRHRDPDFSLESIPENDVETGDLLARAETIGVFQCESQGAQRTLRKLRARRVRDLAIANAFFKPGPAMGGMADAFVRRYRGQEPVTYLHPSLEPILGPTKGVLIFQEQVLRLATEVAGLSWAQADHLRRGMSHFGHAEITALQEQFIAGCQRPAPDGPGMTPAQAARLWDQIVPFSGYGFNQGHATAYAGVSYRSAYLKTHYPAEFLAARLQGSGGFHHPAVYMAEAVRLGIAVRPPHINFSGTKLALTDGPSLYLGLGQVRDLRQSAAHAIVRARGDRAYADLRDLLGRVELQSKEIEHLICCGALDGMGTRSALLAEADLLRRSGGVAQLSFDFAMPVATPETTEQRWAWELELLGVPVSALSDPLAAARDRLPTHAPLAAIAGSPGRSVVTAGMRLPGWTGGPGFLLTDGERFVFVNTGKGGKSPPAWKPLVVRGRWIIDEWSGGSLQASQVALV